MAENEGTENEGTEGTESEETEISQEEALALREENDRLKAAQAKARTAKAREAKAKADAERAAAKEDGDTAALRKQLEAAEASNKDLSTKLIRSSIRSAAATAGAVDPSVVARLVDVDSLDDPTDEDEIQAAVEQLLKDKPYLKGAKKADPDAGKGAGKGQETSTDMNAIIRRGAGRG